MKIKGFRLINTQMVRGLNFAGWNFSDVTYKYSECEAQ